MTTAPPKASISTWLIEDNPMYRDAMEELLRDADDMYCSLACSTCEEAIEALTDDFLPEVILMDIGLPGMDGIDGVREIRKLAPAVHVIMLTAHHDDDEIFRAICAGASGYLLKTAEPAEILRAVKRVRSGGAPIDARIARRVLDMFTRLAVPREDYGLSDREHEILEHLVDGRTKRQIAERLHLSPHTVDGHVRNIYAKLQVHTRTGAVAKALRENLL